jgi:hypothetical protein
MPHHTLGSLGRRGHAAASGGTSKTLTVTATAPTTMSTAAASFIVEEKPQEFSRHGVQQFHDAGSATAGSDMGLLRWKSSSH